MTNLFPVKPIVEELNNVNGKRLVFTPLTKEQCDNLKKELERFQTFPKLSNKRSDLDRELNIKHKITYSGIIAIGSTTLETRLANTYIENNMFETGDKDKTRIKKRNYKCFANTDWQNPTNKMNLPYHEDGGCAWNCLMQKLRHPEYGVIYNID